LVLAGAGISTAAGIPDFRSPGSGLYHQLAKYNLPEPEDLFCIEYFVENPHPFFEVSKELCPGKFKVRWFSCWCEKYVTDYIEPL
jgi:NAD-dependent deacetylase sirtuin 2